MSHFLLQSFLFDTFLVLHLFCYQFSFLPSFHLSCYHLAWYYLTCCIYFSPLFVLLPFMVQYFLSFYLLFYFLLTNYTICLLSILSLVMKTCLKYRIVGKPFAASLFLSLSLSLSLYCMCISLYPTANYCLEPDYKFSALSPPLSQPLRQVPPLTSHTTHSVVTRILNQPISLILDIYNTVYLYIMSLLNHSQCSLSLLILPTMQKSVYVPERSIIMYLPVPY